MGRALARRCSVTIATPYVPEIQDVRCELAPYAFDDPATIQRLADRADVIVVQGFTLARYPSLVGMHVPLVVDLYCPFTLEYLEQATSPLRADFESGRTSLGALSEIATQVTGFLGVQNLHLQHGDLFLVASERQRDFWLGALHAAAGAGGTRRLDPAAVRGLIEIVPFGVSDEDIVVASARIGPVLKGVRPGISRDDRLLVWGGSILDWQDPQTLVRAIAILTARRSDVKLFFMGTRHPTPGIAPMRALDESLAIARAHGLLDRHVFFNEWVPYEERAAYLTEADLGVSTHLDHLETRLSFRTRMLDYLWAALPIVCTDGDHFAELVRERALGLTVPPGDAETLAAAIGRLLDDASLRLRCRDNLRLVAEENRWSRVVAPLERFCAAPRLAPDREAMTTRRR
jgi:glycosyltransferase involved in cell wall biosynthesis